jgi:hypothetical protein
MWPWITDDPDVPRWARESPDVRHVEQLAYFKYMTPRTSAKRQPMGQKTARLGGLWQNGQLDVTLYGCKAIAVDGLWWKQTDKLFSRLRLTPPAISLSPRGALI